MFDAFEPLWNIAEPFSFQILNFESGKPIKTYTPMPELVNIFAGEATVELAQKIARAYGVKLGEARVQHFSDGEFQPSFEETIRGNAVFIIQSTFAPSENLFELLLMIDAAKRASARRVIAMLPYFGFARQDRKDKPRVSIGAKLIANLITAAGADRIITMDLHSDQIQGFFDMPVDHMYASSIFVPYLQNLELDDLCISSPDTGGTKRAAAYAKFLNADLAICYKQRIKANEIDKMTLIGEVENKHVVLVDDIIDTAGTITMAADMIMEHGAKSVRAMCTHPIFSGKAVERIEKSALTEVIVTDTIPLKKNIEKVTVLSAAELFADVIDRVYRHKSISTHFQFTTML